jgi:hypothetical protein
MPLRDAPLAFQRVLKPATAREILTMPLAAQQIADRWSLAWPAEVAALDAEGRFVEVLRTQLELERAALERASGPEYAHLADHEKLEIMGPPPGL